MEQKNRTTVRQLVGYLRYDTEAERLLLNPYTRTMAHPAVTALPKRRLAKQHPSSNPAAVRRQIQALPDQLLTLATTKAGPAPKTARHPHPQADLSDEATTQRSRTC